MANCTSCNGGCGTGTRVCALNSLSRSGCRFPYYTGPCPSTPCVDSCGNSSACGCHCRRNAAVIDLNSGCGGSCGCNGCNGCNGCGGCGHCGGCASCNGPCGCSNCASPYGRSGGNACDGCGNGYNWECASCGCDNCGTDCCSNCGNSWHGCGAAIHGAFTCGGPINLSAGGSVNFESHRTESGHYSASYGSILIRRPGLYYVHVTADIPKNTDADTVMRLELDGQAITPPELVISTGCGCGSSSYSGCAIIRACSGSVLKLVTLRDLCIETTTAQPVFTLWILPIAHGCHA